MVGVAVVGVVVGSLGLGGDDVDVVVVLLVVVVVSVVVVRRPMRKGLR